MDMKRPLVGNLLASPFWTAGFIITLSLIPTGVRRF